MPPDWLLEWGSQVCKTWELIGNVGFYVEHHGEDGWRLFFYPELIEDAVVTSIRDPEEGLLYSPSADIDILAVIDLFDEVESCNWKQEDDGYLRISGKVQDEYIEVELLPFPPEGARPTLRLTAKETLEYKR